VILLEESKRGFDSLQPHVLLARKTTTAGLIGPLRFDPAYLVTRATTDGISAYAAELDSR
jgi:hypothetical protein